MGCKFDSKDLKRFKEYMELNLRLTPVTVKHTGFIVLRYLNGAKWEVNYKTLSKYLHKYLKKAPWTYNTQIVALRRFFKFLGLSEIISKFKLAPIDSAPNNKYKLPTKEQVEIGLRAQASDADRALYAFLATTGLRAGEAFRITKDKIDLEARTVIPRHWTRTKATGITFLTPDSKKILENYLEQRTDKDPRAFPLSDRQIRKIWIRASNSVGMKITPQVLRVWFSSEMGERGVPDRFVDIFQGRAPRSVIARSYTGIEVERLRAVYDKASLSIDCERGEK
jgi:integrase